VSLGVRGSNLEEGYAIETRIKVHRQINVQ
jgi:hypothetical protein